MKLPGIDYGGRERRLATISPGMAVQTANAWAGAANAWAQAIDTIGREADQIKAQEADIGASQEIADVVGQIKSGVWNVSERGQPPADFNIDTRNRMGDQATYQMHEFAGQYYDKRLKEITDKYTKGLSGRAKRAFYNSFSGKAASQRINILESQAKQKKETNKAAWRKVNDDLIAQVTPGNAQQTAAQVRDNINMAYKAGYFTLEEARRFENDRIADIEYTIHTSAMRTNDLGQLRSGQESLATQPSRMPVTMKNQLWTQYQRKIDASSREYEASRKEAREEMSARKLNIVLAEIYEGGGYIEYEPINDMDMTEPHKKIALAAARAANNRSQSEGDPTLANDIRSQIVDLKNPSETPMAVRVDTILSQIQANAAALGRESVTLSRQAMTFAEAGFVNEAYRSAEELIDLRLVGMAKSNNSYGTQNQANIANATDMKMEMRQAAIEQGASFDPVRWVQGNMPRYLTKKSRKVQEKATKQRNQNYIKRDADGRPDAEASRKSIDDALDAEEINQQQADQIESEIMPDIEAEQQQFDLLMRRRMENPERQ